MSSSFWGARDVGEGPSREDVYEYLVQVRNEDGRARPNRKTHFWRRTDGAANNPFNQRWSSLEIKGQPYGGGAESDLAQAKEPVGLWIWDAAYRLVETSEWIGCAHEP